LAAQTHEIGNWLGIEKIAGFEFAQKAEAHAKSYGKAKIITTLVDEIGCESSPKRIRHASQERLRQLRLWHAAQP
jgi:thioredoxin reductase